jgi:hypothetical protein
MEDRIEGFNTIMACMMLVLFAISVAGVSIIVWMALPRKTQRILMDFVDEFGEERKG